MKPRITHKTTKQKTVLDTRNENKMLKKKQLKYNKNILQQKQALIVT